MTNAKGFDWEAHPETIEQLKSMWEAGHSGSEIALAIGNGLTKNAIIGRVTRMKLIRHRGVEKRRAPPKPVSDPTVKIRPLPKPKEKFPPPECPVSILAPEIFAGHGECQFIHGDPAQRGWKMCGHPVKEDRRWCEYHWLISIDHASTARVRSQR